MTGKKSLPTKEKGNKTKENPPNPRKRGDKGEKSSARQATVERYSADPIAIQLNAKFGNDIAANNMTIKAMQHFMDAAVDLSAIGYTPEQIKPALKIMDSKAENWSHGYGLDGFMRYAADILKQIQRKKQPALVSDTRPFIPMLYQAAIERGEMTEAEVLNIMSGGAA